MNVLKLLINVAPTVLAQTLMDHSDVLVMRDILREDHVVKVNWILEFLSFKRKKLISFIVQAVFSVPNVDLTVWTLISFIYFFLDIDECSLSNVDCHANAYCTNTDGSYSCTCHSGYTGSGTACYGKWLYTLFSTFQNWCPIHIINTFNMKIYSFKHGD